VEEEVTDIVDDEEKADKLESLIERKVEEKVKSVVGENREEKNKAKKQTGGVSRRGFLKKLGASAIGLGALSLSPVSSYNIRSSDALEVYNSGTKYFDVNPGGPVEVLNSQLKVKGNTVWHAGNDGSGSGLDADTVDGKEASEIGGDSVTARRDRSGNAKIVRTNTFTVQKVVDAPTATVQFSGYETGFGDKRYHTTTVTSPGTGDKIRAKWKNHHNNSFRDTDSVVIKKNGNQVAYSGSRTYVSNTSTRTYITTAFTSFTNNDSITFVGRNMTGTTTYTLYGDIYQFSTGSTQKSTQFNTTFGPAWASTGTVSSSFGPSNVQLGGINIPSQDYMVAEFTSNEALKASFSWSGVVGTKTARADGTIREGDAVNK